MRGFRGEPVIVTFLYTTCEDTCPLQAQTVRGALDQLGHDVPAIAIAVDPPRDTPERARAFLSEQRALGRLDFVLGTRDELRPLWQGFAIRPQSVTEEHQARITLVDPRGYQRVGYPGSQATPERLAHDLRLLENARRLVAPRVSPTHRVGFSRMMFSTKAEYGVRVMAHLAAARRGERRRRRAGVREPISLGSIADAEGLPLAYLEHLVQRLRRAELVESRRGAHGGYTLARPARGHQHGRGGERARGRDRPDRVHHRRSRARRSSASARASWDTIPAPRSSSGPAYRGPSSAR